MSATILSVSSRALLDACARLGLDTQQILKAAGVDEATVQDSDARIPIDQVDALWRSAYELSNDPDLGLHAIEVLPFGAYRVIDFLASSAPTIGAALARVSEYFPLISAAVRLPYSIGSREVTYALEGPHRASGLGRPYAEYTLAAIFLRTRIGTRTQYRLIRVDFGFPRPPCVTEHERIFDCPVHFGAGVTQLVVAREMWDTPSTGGDPGLFSVLDAHARMLLDQLPKGDDVVARVREAIAAELRGGNPKLESIAKQLAMSPRTLQRRLREHGQIFNDVLDSMRFHAAKAYLSQRDIASAEVAFLLGFAAQSSFNHAFRRWSGQTPTTFRRGIVAV